MNETSFASKALTFALLVGGATSVLLHAGCNEFDPALYEEAEKNTGGAAGSTGGTGGESGGAGASGAGGSAPAENWSQTKDWCPLPEALVLSSDQRVHSGEVSLNTLVSDVEEVPNVTGLGGPDGVIGLKLAAQERVAVRYDFAKAPGEQDPDVDLAMYLMGSCGTAGFIRRNDRCPSGQGEDLWWQMNDVAAAYYLGFDSKGYDQGSIDPRVKLTVSFPRYGDGVVDEGEACDDSNKIDADGCTHDGLWELKYAGSIVQEKEPNDHPWGANVILMDVGQTMVVSALTSGTCDNDFFALDVPEGAFPRVEMLDSNGQPCNETVGKITMQFNRLDGTKNVEQVKLGDGKPEGANNCPSWTETSLGLVGLPAARYVVELKGFEVGKASVPYRLKIELAIPEAL
jgi:cysteine-rich repeat protein